MKPPFLLLGTNGSGWVTAVTFALRQSTVVAAMAGPVNCNYGSDVGRENYGK